MSGTVVIGVSRSGFTPVSASAQVGCWPVVRGCREIVAVMSCPMAVTVSVVNQGWVGCCR